MALEVFHRSGTEGLGTGYYEVERPRRPARLGRGVNVGHRERWISVVIGGALAAYALRRWRRESSAAAFAGAAMLHRGMTGHCNVYQALGVNRARDREYTPQPRGEGRGTGVIADFGSDTRQKLGGKRGIHVEEAVTINRPIDEVFRFWRNLENLPQFMEHLESVSTREAGVTHWRAKAPAGMSVEWDARIINEIDNKVIGWQSLEGSTVSTAGSVNFDQDPHGTRVTVHLQYGPPAGRLGAAVARLFGEEPSQTIREDLRRFKRLLETGEIATTEGQPSGRRSARRHNGHESRRRTR
jgi:uncharacterized membrane protein